MSDEWKGPYVTIDDAMKIVAERDEFKADVELLGQALQSMTLDCAAKIEESDELRNQIDKQTKKFLDDFNVRADLNREIWKLKQLFIDLTFCYLNKGSITEILYQDSLKDFKEIVGDDPEFVNNGGEG